MRRVIMFLLALITFVLLLSNYNPANNMNPGFGDNDPTAANGLSKLTILIVIDGKQKPFLINKFGSIRKEDIPVDSNRQVTGIFYDVEYNNEYHGESIKINNIILYARTEEKYQETPSSLPFSLYDNSSLNNDGYSGVFLIKDYIMFENHFSHFPMEEGFSQLQESFSSSYFVDKELIIVYALTGPKEKNIIIEEISKIGSLLEVLLSYNKGEEDGAKYHLFIIMIDKTINDETSKATISIINRDTLEKSSYYYVDNQNRKEASVLFHIGSRQERINVLINNTISIYDVFDDEQYKDANIYYDQDFHDLYTEPIIDDQVLYIGAKQLQYSVVFIIEDLYKSIIVDDEYIIALDDIPKIEGIRYLGLYYDKNYLVIFNNLPVTSNIVLYVKWDFLK